MSGLQIHDSRFRAPPRTFCTSGQLGSVVDHSDVSVAHSHSFIEFPYSFLEQFLSLLDLAAVADAPKS